MTTQALVFQNTTFSIVDRNNQPWLRAAEIAQALGYANENAITRIYARNKDEFTETMTETVKLTLSGNLQNEIRIFSMRGAHLIAMLARTEVAKAFRKWILDLIDKQPLGNISRAQAGELASLLAEHFPDGKHRPYAWSRFNNHFRLASYRDLPAEKFEAARAYIQQMPVKPKALTKANQPGIEGEYMPASNDPETLNSTIARMTQQVEAGNGTPAEVFLPLVKAVIKKRPELLNEFVTEEQRESLMLSLLCKHRYSLSFMRMEGGAVKPQINTHHADSQTLVPQAVINDIRDRSFNFFPDSLIPDLIGAIADRISAGQAQPA
ncbi:MAG: BRO family protein [Azonexus sp.]|nr:BRO family protein [Azonexus sp.]